MSEVKVVLRDASRSRSGTIHGACAGRFVAALAADPVTLEELDVAIERFMPRHEGHSFFSWFHNGIDDEPWDAGLVVIDLAAKLVYVESTYSHPSKEGSVDYHNGQCATDVRCRYRLKDDWYFTSGWDHWQSRAEERRTEFAATPPLDVRAVLYGRPLIEFLATECFRQFARREELLHEAHAKWIADTREWIEKSLFYIAGLDEQVRLLHESPSIGLILCRDADQAQVRLALTPAAQKVGVATYETALPDLRLIQQRFEQFQLPAFAEEQRP